jgi:putative Mg2+ transporter-C (MgtC) family protein
MLGHFELVARLVLAAALGSVIGFERERLSWAAGLRTHMLVCVGSTLIMIVSAYGFGEVLGEHVVLDPSRMAAQVVSGIGFLGAGSRPRRVCGRSPRSGSRSAVGCTRRRSRRPSSF